MQPGRSFVLFVLLVLSAAVVGAETFDAATTGTAAGAAAIDDARALWSNPAALGPARGPNGYFALAGLEDTWEDYAAALQLGPLALGYRRRPGVFEDDYYGRFSLGLGFGDRRLSFGLGLDWFTEHLGALDDTAFDLRCGVLWRPWSFLSLGGVLENALGAEVGTSELHNRLGGAVALRPLAPFLHSAPDLLTLAFDGGWTADPEDLVDEAEQFDWRASLELRPLDGLALTASYDDAGGLTVGAALELSHAVLGYGGALTEEGEFTRHGGWTAFNLDRREPLVCLAPPGVLTLTVAGALDDVDAGFSLLPAGTVTPLRRLLGELERARRDDDVDAVLLTIHGLGGFFGEVTGSIQELGAEIDRTRAAGLPVYAVLAGGGIDPGALYLAAFCDRVFLPPLSDVGGLGMALNINRYGGLAEKYGVDLETITAGDYKSSFWPTTKGASAEQAAAIQSLLDDNHAQLCEQLAERRGLSAAELAELTDTWLLHADEALAYGLVDELGEYRDALTAAARAAGDDVDNADGVRVVGLAERTYWEDEWSARPRIAVIGAYGAIHEGDSTRDLLRGGRTMGGRTVAGQLDRARRDPLVEAIVLRIDSGGGSGIASDQIFRAVKRCLEDGKPVIASMADIAASGGYWIACPADYILAEGASAVGSIGVVGIRASLERLFAEEGIVRESYTVGEHADLGDYGSRLTDEEKAMLEEELEYFYDIFVEKVAAERELELDEVYELAGGRVWTGRQALEGGLIDELGGLRRAVELAAERAGIEHPDPDIITYGDWGPFFMELVSRDLVELLGYGDLAVVELDL